MTYRPALLPRASFAADAPELPVRQRGDLGEPDYLISASLVARDEAGLRLTGVTQTAKRVNVSFSLTAPGVVHVLMEEKPDPRRVTLARQPSSQPVNASIDVSDGQVTIASDLISVQIELDPFHVTYLGPDGQPLLEQNSGEYDAAGYLTVLPFGFSAIEGERVAFHDTFNVEPDEHFYGFGEKFTDFDKRGQRLEMWLYDAYGVHTERTYKPVPFFVSTRGYGIFVDSISCVQFDMAHSNHSTFSLVVPDSALDYYVIVGPDLKTIITRYASLVSFPILPPRWAFGLWMSSGFQRDSAEEVLRRAHQVRQQQVPCDVLHLDCYWQKLGCWSDMAWDEEMFPDPEGLIKEVKAQDLRVCLWMNPYIGIESERFAEARAKGYLLKNAQGQAYVANLWGGGDKSFHPPVGIVDLTNPQARTWFGDLLRPLLRMGVDVFKTDFGEGVPADALAHNGMTGEQLHNLYTLLYNDLVSEVTAQETQRAGLLWGRSTYAGGQRHAAQWGGDAISTYQGLASTLRGGLNLGLCGHAFWSHDIGGFHLHPDHRPPADLYVRWAQFGLFSPLSRMHGAATRLPWDYGDEALRIVRDYVRLRYRLLPYIYTYASLAAQTSLPLMRAMVLEYPDDPVCHTLDLQYMFGAELLAAPIYNRAGRRPVYLPAGRWVDFWTHEVIQGPHMQVVEAPLDVMPLFVRANALIPTIEPPEFIGDAPFDPVTFDAYLFEQGRFDLQDVDGTSQVAASIEGSQLDVRVQGAKKQVGLRLFPLPGVPAVEVVQVNGVALEQVDTLETGPHTTAAWPQYAPAWTRDTDGTVRVKT